MYIFSRLSSKPWINNHYSKYTLFIISKYTTNKLFKPRINLNNLTKPKFIMIYTFQFSYNRSYSTSTYIISMYIWRSSSPSELTSKKISIGGLHIKYNKNVYFQWFNNFFCALYTYTHKCDKCHINKKREYLSKREEILTKDEIDDNIYLRSLLKYCTF